MSGVSTLLNRYRGLTDPELTQRRIELVALALSVILVLQLLYSVARLSIATHPEAISPAPDSLVVSELQYSGMVTSQQSEEIRARPVFWPSRRPVDAPDETVASERPRGKKSSLDKVELLGVFGAGDSAGIIAVVKGKKKRILLGDKVVGWALDSIDRDRAVFVDGGRSQTLVLKYASAASAPTPDNTAKKFGQTSGLGNTKPRQKSGLR